MVVRTKKNLLQRYKETWRRRGMGWLQEQIFKETGNYWWNLVEKAKRMG